MANEPASPPSWQSKCAYNIFKLMGMMPLNVLRNMGLAIGYLLWKQKGQTYKITKKNIELCFPDISSDEQQALTRRSILETAMGAAEFTKVWTSPWQQTRQHIKAVHGGDLFQQAVASEQGTIVLAPHLGNWEVLNYYLAEQTEMTVLYQPAKQKSLDWVVKVSREASGSKAVPTSVRGVMTLSKTLKAGGSTGILPDQQPELSGGTYAPFFGQTALTINLIDSLSKKNNCILLMGYAKRVQDGFEIVFSEPDPAIYAEEKLEAITAMNRSVERCVRECPEQYQWEYKRFNKQPEGNVRPYKGL